MQLLFAVIFGLISMMGYATANVFSQPLARKWGTQQLLFLRGFGVCLILAVASLGSLEFFLNIRYVALAVGLGVVGYLPLLAFTHGLKVSKVGIVAPIAGASPFVTVLLAFLILHNPLSAVQWVAIVVLLAANIIVSVNFKSLRHSNIVQLKSGVPYAFVAMVGWGLFFFALIYPTKVIGPWATAFLVELGVTIAAGVHIVVTKQKVQLTQAASPKILANGLAIVIGTAAFTVGVSRYNASILSALSNSTALPASLLAVYFFKERLTTLEKLAAGAMVIAVLLISLG
jgi:drug/metabolite transporter (DMT)-like permease